MGAGFMGAQIALHCAVHGRDVAIAQFEDAVRLNLADPLAAKQLSGRQQLGVI